MIAYIVPVVLSKHLGAYHVISGKEKLYGQVFYLDRKQSRNDAWFGCVNYCEREGIILIPSKCRRIQ